MRESVPFILGVLLTTAAASIIGLFLTPDASQTWDILKLSVQGIGALVFARLGVVWAVEKFKSEKRWERDANTFSEALAALREMNRANDILWDDETGARSRSEQSLKDVGERWRVAKKQFEAAAARSVFLPKEISSIILQLEADLANQPTHDSWADSIEHEGKLILDALQTLERKIHLL
ncbi:hypothetical protein [Bradyrhizobium sp. SZCCHNRI3042]|uniref:hypothetical protein n=1 Tax=Bradyrhizobium sp. SZCCHNRI3042 TaxID=3057291 RepID=UPI00291663C9|nr:hypothetical protein [Bradyrhizobium sp. SZCCHNRI3042]